MKALMGFSPLWVNPTKTFRILNCVARELMFCRKYARFPLQIAMFQRALEAKAFHINSNDGDIFQILTGKRRDLEPLLRN